MNGTMGFGASRIPAAWAVALAGMLCGAMPAMVALGDEPPTSSRRMRNVVLKKLPENTQIIGLEFTIIHVDTNGNRKAIDVAPEAFPFKIGDSFLLRIKPQDDVFVYVFTEGPQGRRTRLLPASAGTPMRVKADEEIVIPDDGNLFTFEAPAGEEKLLVVALREHNPDLLLIQEAAFQRGGRTLRSELDKALDGLEHGVNESRRMRGVKRTMVERPPEISPGSGRCQVEATADKESPMSEVIGINTSELVVGISLNSRSATLKSP